jgi:hypothetical protein
MNRIRSPRSHAHFNVAAAFDDVQTTPPRSPPAERLHGRGGVDVGDRHDRADTHLLEIGPAHLELFGVHHVRHRTAGSQIREDHLLVIGAQHVGAFRHEVHAAEDDELGVRVPGDLLGQLVRVAGVVGELDHFVALVVVPEDHEPAAELLPGRGDALVHLGVGQADVALRERLALGEVALLVFRQDR